MNAKQNRVAKRKRHRDFPEGCYVKVTLPYWNSTKVSYGYMEHYPHYPYCCRVQTGGGMGLSYVPFRCIERAEEPK